MNTAIVLSFGLKLYQKNRIKPIMDIRGAGILTRTRVNKVDSIKKGRFRGLLSLMAHSRWRLSSSTVSIASRREFLENEVDPGVFAASKVELLIQWTRKWGVKLFLSHTSMLCSCPYEYWLDRLNTKIYWPA